jgi:hypothetical protein
MMQEPRKSWSSAEEDGIIGKNYDVKGSREQLEELRARRARTNYSSDENFHDKESSLPAKLHLHNPFPLFVANGGGEREENIPAGWCWLGLSGRTETVWMGRVEFLPFIASTTVKGKLFGWGREKKFFRHRGRGSEKLVQVQEKRRKKVFCSVNYELLCK